ncbi:MAG: hypothetical protein MZV70_40620 [Desulfobacterales bacterium]|nr:hypothetical protein [Desulfobacterales bacterium]
MEKVPQKLDKTRAEYYKGAPIAKFGERTGTHNGYGQEDEEPPQERSARWSASRPAGRLTAFSAAR